MRLITTSVLVVLALVAPKAAAQDPAPQAVASQSEVIVQTPGQQTTPNLDEYLAYQLKDQENRIRRVRIALITSTAAFAVGVILNAAWAASNCDGNDDVFSCNLNADPALSGIGGFFIGAGSIAMLTTGIMLGVRNKRKRDLERQIRKRGGTAFHWDMESGRFRF